MKDKQEIIERIKELYQMVLDEISEHGVVPGYITDEIKTLKWVLDE